MLSALATSSDKMKATFDPFMLTTSVADYLVREGVPFRETHHIFGRCAAESEQTDTSMNGSSFEHMKQIYEHFEPDISRSFNCKTSVKRRSAMDGTSISSVLELIQMLSAILE